MFPEVEGERIGKIMTYEELKEEIQKLTDSYVKKQMNVRTS